MLNTRVHDTGYTRGQEVGRWIVQIHTNLEKTMPYDNTLLVLDTLRTMTTIRQKLALRDYGMEYKARMVEYMKENPGADTEKMQLGH